MVANTDKVVLCNPQTAALSSQLHMCRKMSYKSVILQHPGSKQGFAGLYRALQGCTRACRAEQGLAGLNRALQG